MSSQLGRKYIVGTPPAEMVAGRVVCLGSKGSPGTPYCLPHYKGQCIVLYCMCFKG
jgi:hypothetical protein